MKKTIKSLLAIAVAAFAFTACSDVPEPEGYNQDKGKMVFPPEGTGLVSDPYNVAGVISGMKDLAKGKTTAGDIYTRGYVAKIDEFNDSYGNLTYSITDSPEGNYGKTDAFIVYRCLGLDKAKFASATDLKVGDAVTICGKITNYNGTIEYAQGCYLIKLNDKTSGGGGGQGGGGDIPSGPNLLTNGDFETWTENAPDNWNGVTGNGTFEKSTAGRSGNALLFKGASQNKRLAYKEIKLKTGTYFISGYAKAATEKTASLRPGYAKLTNGKVADSQNDYKYGSYVNGITNAEWTQFSHSFTLDEETSLNIIFMNPGSSNADVLLDDITLTTSDGGIVDGGGESGGGDEPGGGGQPTGNSYFEESFASGKGNFTISDKSSTGGVWNAATYQSDNFMKATSYIEKANKDAESWLISPEIDIAAATNPTLSFAQAINGYFGTIANEAMVFAKKDGGEWTKLTITYPEKPSKGFTQFVAQTVSLANFKSSKTQIAFVYKGTTAAAGTWEVKDVKVAEAK